MKILINCSKLKAGGGVQVGDSILSFLGEFPEHRFVAVLSEALAYVKPRLEALGNVSAVEVYDMPVTPAGMLLGRDRHMDEVVEREGVEGVLTVFGPSLWRPKVPHVCGFARPHIIYKDSPFFKTLPRLTRMKWALAHWLMKRSFRQTADAFWTENADVSRRFAAMVGKPVETVTNNCNQIFGEPERWAPDVELPPFEGTTLLTVSANYPHKNLGIIPRVIDRLEGRRVRFVLTLRPDDLPLTAEQREHVVFLGPVNIAQVPGLYRRADVMFLPTLLECFSASYAEAMKMGVPVLTSDLEFARGICGAAAEYCDTLDPAAVLAALDRLAAPGRRAELIAAGRAQQATFDTPLDRARKLIDLTTRTHRI